MKVTLISTSTTPSDQGIRTVSSVLKKAGHSVNLVFMTASEDYSQLYSIKALKQLKNLCKNADFIGLSSMTSTARRAIQIIKFLKYLRKPIVWGGVHATLAPEKCIQYADLVCVGEGEGAVIDLVKAFEKQKDPNKIMNLWVKKNGKIIKNPPRPLIQDLDKLPFVDYDTKGTYLLKRNKLVKFSEHDLNGYIFFLTGRGCPYCCTYCSNKAFNNLYQNKWGKVRWHSPDYIIKGIKLLKKRYPTLKIFDIRDDTFSLRPLSQIKEFAQKYKKEIGLRMKCLGDPRTISEEKIRILIDAGCTDIIVGIQGSERVNLEVYKRPQKDKDVMNANKILNKFKGKIAVMYDVITSNPYESSADVLNLINLIKKLHPPYYLSVNNLVFFTGSELYNQALKEGIIKSEEDAAIELNYWDRWKHIRLKKKNMYLNLILNLMRGSVSKSRFGTMPRVILNILTKPNIIKFNNKNKLPTYIFGSLVGFSDLIREKVAKPLYRSLPLDFKVWYDKARYRV